MQGILTEVDVSVQLTALQYKMRHLAFSAFMLGSGIQDHYIAFPLFASNTDTCHTLKS